MRKSSLFHIDRCVLGWRLISHLLFRHFAVSLISNDNLSPEIAVDLRRYEKFLPIEEMICLETTIPGLFHLDDAMSSQRRGTQGRYAAMRTQSARLVAQIEMKNRDQFLRSRLIENRNPKILDVDFLRSPIKRD